MAAETTSPFKGAIREGPWSSPFAGAVRVGRWQPEAEQPQGAPPQGAAPLAPISAQDIARHESEAAATPGIKPEDVGEEATRRIMTQHSIALGPEDKRVTLRINPDTGSLRTTGAYFIPGDPAHERMLSGLSAEHRAKLAPISTAIGRGDPFTFLHYSAPEEDIEAEEAARERPTAETRQFEQRQSTAEERAAGAEGQLQRATIIPQQFNVTKPKKATKNKPAVPSKILLEGFASDKALNNAVHGINDAKIANVAVPYQDTGFNFQKDLAGYIQNQQHGYRGDGSGPMMDASNLPVKAHQAEMAKPPGQQYIPHLLSPEQAMFINMAMNIVPSGTTRPEKERPTFSENAQWLSRVNQGYIGQEGGVNRMREELDRKMPSVGIRNKKGDVTRRVPWSKGVLEPTYAAFRLENIHSTLPSPLEAQSLRAREGVPHEAHIIQKAPVAVHTAGEFKIPAWQKPKPAPISENPEMGAPVGEGQEAAEKPTPGLLKTAGTPAEEQPDYTQESAAGFNPRQLGGSYPEPQIPEQAPPEIPRPGGVEFASPNIRENISYQSAKRALKGPAQQRLRSFGDRLEEAASHHLGLEQARNSDLIGDWVDGAENSTITNYGNHPPEVRKVISALKGLHGGQKNVARFHFDPEGPHDYYKLAFDSDNVEDVRKALSEEGVNFRSIEPSEKGKRVVAHIIDSGDYNREGIENLIKSGKIYEAESRSGQAEFPGDPNEKSRYDAARNFRGILQEARDQAYQGEGGRGDQPLQWWEPFEKEAEESFRQLRENDLFKRQAQAEDQRRAAIDREDISPENQAHLDALHGIGKDWTAQHPDINERPGFAKSTFAYMLGHKKFPRDDMTKRDIGEFFDQIHDTLDFNKPAHREIAADSLLFDIMHSLAGTLTGKPSSAYGWYDRTVSKTMAKVATFLPKVAEDPAHELAFKIGLAATSQGQDVFPNGESAYHVYKYWEKFGKLPEDRKFFGGGTKAEQMEENFKKINELWKTHGTDKLREILEEPMSVKELEEKYGLQVSGEAKGHVVRGAMGMGPKIGSFLSNLLGHFDSTTMDLWFSRNLNMIAGNMFGFSEKPMKQGTTDYAPQLEDLKKLLDSGDITAASPEAQEKMRKEIAKLEAVKEGKMTRTRALKLAPELHNWAEQATKNYMRSYRGTEGFEDMPAAFKRSWHPDFDTPENGLAKRMHENVQELSDAPRNASERDNWRKVMGLVNHKLAEHGVHLTNADKQALGWFDIKDLFKLAGSNSKQNADYLDAAYQLARRLEYGEIPDLTEVE